MSAPADHPLIGDYGLIGDCQLEDTLVQSGRPREAGAVFDRALSTANHVGLFSERYGPEAGAMLGNAPRGLTHYAHIAATRALARQPAEVGAEEGTRAT